MNTATRIHSWPQAANEFLQEYIQRFTDLVIPTTGKDLSEVTCHVTNAFSIRHLLNKKIKKQIAGAKTIQPLSHSLTLAQEAEIKLKV